MDVHEYLGVLRRGALLIVIGVLVGLLGGAFVQSMEGPSYAATSRDLVTNKTSGDLTEWLQASNFTESRIASYVLVASSGLVLQPVIDDLGLDTTVEDLARRISVAAPPATFIIEITATATTPEEARDIANAVSAEFSDVVANQLETAGGTPTAATPTPGATAQATPKPSPSTTKLPNGTVVPITQPIAPVRIVNIEEAVLPTQPLPSNSGLILIVGGVLGLTAGLVAASLREVLDTRVRGPKDVEAIAPIPVIGEIPADRTVKTAPIVARPGSGTRIAEAFRALRAHLDHVRTRDGRNSFVVTAAGHGQGATTVTANLAVAVANTATSVVVVDADLRSSALSRMFGIHGAPGLTEVLSARTPLDAALRSGIAGGVTVLPSGARPSNPGELLASAGMRDLLAELRRRYDVVLVDTPPIVAVTDAAVLGSLDCATVLVLAPGSTTRQRLEDALGRLAAGGSTARGIVLNAAPRRPGRGARRPESEAAGEVFAPVPQAPAAVGPAPVVEPAAPVVVVQERAVQEPVVQEPVVHEPVAHEPAHVAPPVTVPEKTGPKPVSRKHVVQVPAAREPEPAAASAVTEIEHTIGTARQLDSAFAALPKASPAAVVPSDAAPDIEDSEPTFLKPSLRAGQVELPLITRPDPVKPSRFAPDPGSAGAGSAGAGSARAGGAYAKAAPPQLGTEGTLPPAPVHGTVVNTVSIRVRRDEPETPTAPPPIRHILPRPGSTIPPKEVEAVRPAPEPEADAEPELIEVHPRTGPVPVPALALQLPVDDDPTAETPPAAEPPAGSLLGEIGGLPRIEVRAARPTAISDAPLNPERTAR
ncbi:MAG TPA: polysaccharide biosynthesis tyrosine autokinase, partial [Pseudolysinimonas sp.]|nr:polysaccharide biosynthesis tyrosine autokinase [Pseudolysinimonas sp.]